MKADRLLVDRVAQIGRRASWDARRRYSDSWDSTPEHERRRWRAVALAVLVEIGFEDAAPVEIERPRAGGS